MNTWHHITKPTSDTNKPWVYKYSS